MAYTAEKVRPSVHVALPARVHEAGEAFAGPDTEWRVYTNLLEGTVTGVHGVRRPLWTFSMFAPAPGVFPDEEWSIMEVGAPLTAEERSESGVPAGAPVPVLTDVHTRAYLGATRLAEYVALTPTGHVRFAGLVSADPRAPPDADPKEAARAAVDYEQHMRNLRPLVRRRVAATLNAFADRRGGQTAAAFRDDLAAAVARNTTAGTPLAPVVHIKEEHK